MHKICPGHLSESTVKTAPRNLQISLNPIHSSRQRRIRLVCAAAVEAPDDGHSRDAFAFYGVIVQDAALLLQ